MKFILPCVWVVCWYRRLCILGGVLLLMVQCVTGEDMMFDNEKPAGRYITQVDKPSVTYQGLLASFGNRMPDDIQVNLMLPPDHQNDPYLCAYPEMFTNSSDAEIKALAEQSLHQPVALLVAVGGPCSTEEKARVMLRMQANVSAQIQVLVLYETDRKYANWFISLAPDSEVVAPEFDNVAILYFPYRHIPKMKLQLNSIKAGNPLLLRPGNEDWSFEHKIEGFWIPIDPDDANRPPDIDGYEFEPSNDYYWIRYVLFSLLIFSPCFRAGYLFYAGGGRLRFRRNERGRVVGLQLIPPMPHWLSHGRPPQSQEPVSSVLSEEEFEGLPEVTYSPTPDEHDENVEAMASEREVENNPDVSGDPELGTAGDSEDDEPIGLPPVASGDDSVVLEDENNISNDAAREEVTTTDPSDVAPVLPTYSRFSECSICIDEFEIGERLTLLPRCQHAFHKDCIRPWLLERQGRCPLCKTCVMHGDHETDDSEPSVDDGSASAAESG